MIICMNCRLAFETVEIGVLAVEHRGAEETREGIVRIWNMDILQCNCGRQILRTSDGQHPTAHGEKARALVDHAQDIGRVTIVHYYGDAR